MIIFFVGGVGLKHGRFLSIKYIASRLVIYFSSQLAFFPDQNKYLCLNRAVFIREISLGFVTMAMIGCFFYVRLSKQQL